MAREKESEQMDLAPDARETADDAPTQDDVDAAVAAHNDAEIAKAREALDEANPK